MATEIDLVHNSVVSRACDVLIWHSECPPMPDGTEGLAYAMEAALLAVREDLITNEQAGQAQDAAEGRRLAAALIREFQSNGSWEPLERAMNALQEWVNAGAGGA